MRIEIKHRLTADVLFAHEADGNTLKITLEAAVKAGADLAYANLARADLAYANLARADLADANLARADLARADLARANLADADLARANLAYDNLAHAYLAGAYLARADLVGVTAVIDAGTPDGWRCVGWLRDGWLSVHVGCRDMRLAEGRTYWSGKPDRAEVLLALDYVERVAVLRGWAISEPRKEAP